MVARVLIQAGIYQIGLPGVDVTSANMDQMALDSRWSGHQLYKTGFVDSSNDSSSVVPFGETLPSVPLMLGYADTNITISPGFQYLGFENYKGPNSGADPDFWIYATVTTSSVTFRYKFGNQVGRLYYTLLRRVAG